MDLWLSKRISWQQLHHSQVMGCLVVWLGGCCQQNIPITLPETNVAPENRPLEVWRFLVETTIFLEVVLLWWFFTDWDFHGIPLDSSLITIKPPLIREKMYGTFSKHRRVANPRVAFANRVLKLRDLGKKTLETKGRKSIWRATFTYRWWTKSCTTWDG